MGGEKKEKKISFIGPRSLNMDRWKSGQVQSEFNLKGVCFVF